MTTTTTQLRALVEQRDDLRRRAPFNPILVVELETVERQIDAALLLYLTSQVERDEQLERELSEFKAALYRVQHVPTNLVGRNFAEVLAWMANVKAGCGAYPRETIAAAKLLLAVLEPGEGE